MRIYDGNNLFIVCVNWSVFLVKTLLLRKDNDLYVFKKMTKQ